MSYMVTPLPLFLCVVVQTTLALPLVNQRPLFADNFYFYFPGVNISNINPPPVFHIFAPKWPCMYSIVDNNANNLYLVNVQYTLYVPTYQTHLS